MLAACLVLLLTGETDLPYHRWQETTPELVRAFAPCETRVIEDARAVTAEALRGYRAVAVNYNGPRLGPAQEKALEAFVREGGGLVAFHQALYGEWFGMKRDAAMMWHDGGAGWPEWSKMLGVRWEAAKIGHARRGLFEVKCAGYDVCGESAFHANDELYHGFTLLPGTNVVATAASAREAGGTGGTEPVAWVNQYGKGRVFVTSLGHDATALHERGTQHLFRRAAHWATTGAAPPQRAAAATAVRVLAVTGGHGYPEDFYHALSELPGVQWRHAQSHAEMIRHRQDRYDVLLLHDMYDKIDPKTRDWLKQWVDSGKGVISLHHAIVDYTEWPWWWQEVTGGKFFVEAQGEYKKSSYKEDIEFFVTPSRGKERHPVLEGVPPLLVEDEMYKDMWHAPGIEVLMETANSLNDRPVVYIGPSKTARVVYIQLGHSASTFHNPGFRRLLHNTVEWVARRK
ncbi:MAG: ThuA domain-containing protein [Bryobacteraceae bacterium]|nr:ThuA domain-containing protein [Bryobacteraceae bacterium]